MDLVNAQALVQLRYTISEASSFSGSYEPQNILYDRPHDIKSRWTGAAVAAMAAAVPSGAAAHPSSSTTAQGTAETSGTSSTSAARDGGVSGYPGAGGTRGAGAASIGTGKSPNAPGNGTGATEKQYIIMKLERLSILRKIHFGKFYKSHPCNLKDFKVYGSATTRDPQSKAWTRLLRGGLKNDAIPEAFETRFTTMDGVPFPVRYVKLVPLATHIPNYNFSVWFVALEGVSDPRIVGQLSAAFHQHRESLAIRLILKHLRSRAYHSAFQVLLESSKLDASSLEGGGEELTSVKRPFEHPIVTQLFHALMQGSWDIAEQCLDRAAWGDVSVTRTSHASGPSGSTGDSDDALAGRSETAETSSASLLLSYIDRSVPKPIWTQIKATDQNGDSPCGRGGHQMELDSEKGILWLFGGWSGTQDLSDLWAYYVREGRWRCVSRDVRQQGGPGPRSCHKMIFDPRTGFLYVLGRYVDYDKAPGGNRDTSPYVGASTVSPDRTTTTDGSSTTRGLFHPRFSGASTVEPGAAISDGSNAQRRTDDELFASNRGGSIRLGSGRGGIEPSSTMFGHHLEAGMSGEMPYDQLHSRGTTPTMTGYESDFYRFSTRTERWDRLSADTAAEGGPKLIFDHQMLIDPDTQLIFVFGGRVAHPDANRLEMSGMWKYDVIQRSWTFLFDDHHTHPQSRIPSRVGHTMLLDTPKRGPMAGKRMIWVLAGQRGTTYLADMWTYQLNTGAVREVSKDYNSTSIGGGGPEGAFTQRAVISSEAREIYLFSGLIRRSKNRSENVKSAFWVFNIEQNSWRLVYQHGGVGSRLKRGGQGGSETEDDVHAAFHNGDVDDETSEDVTEPGGGPTQAFPVISMDNAGGDGRASNDVMMTSSDVLPTSSTLRSPHTVGASHDTEPRPRYAAQMVFDTKQNVFYIFGGNPADGVGVNSSARLDDLWSLELIRPSIAEVLRKAKFKLRQQRFLEMAHELDGSSLGSGGMGAMQALMYLQTQVSQVVNHEIAEESQAFRKLMSHLLHAGNGGASSSSSARTAGSSQDNAYDLPGSSPWMSPLPGHGTAETVGGAFSSPLLRTEEGTQTSSVVPSSSTTADPQSDSEGGDSDMLSISQTLPAKDGSVQIGTDAKPPLSTLNSGPPAFLLNNAPSSGALSSASLPSATPQRQFTALEGRPSALYRQRYYLFRALTDFFPPTAVEPNVDLIDCVEMSKLSLF